MTNMLNGWDVQAVSEAVRAIEEQPEAGLLTWRGEAIWDGGFGLDVRTREIKQLEQVMPRHFTVRGDHPVEFLGSNTGTTAIETALAALAALGACVTGTFAVQATVRGIRIDQLAVDLECTIDLNGFFGLEPIRPGLRDVTLTYRVAADAEPDALEEVLSAARSLSPVYDTFARPVPVSTRIAA